MSEPSSQDPSSLHGLTWATERTRYKFFVVWGEDDPDECCVGAESMQAAISATTVLLKCMACGEHREATSETAEIVI